MPLPILGLVGAIAPVVDNLIDNLFETDEEKAAAKVKVMQAAQEGRLKEIEVSMSAIIAEAKSADPWTSRARPSFLYVVYVMILAAIPMGFVSAFNPDLALKVVAGMQGWLAAIPDAMWTLFGAGYLGYSAARSWDKRGKPPITWTAEKK